MVALSGTLLVVYHICAVEHDIFLFFRGDTNILFKSVTYVFLDNASLLSASSFWVWAAPSTTLIL
jgi:hypothetical protein